MGSFESESDFQRGPFGSEGEFSSVSQVKPANRKAAIAYPLQKQVDSLPTKSKPSLVPDPRGGHREKKYRLDPREFPILASISKKSNATRPPMFQSDSEHDSTVPIPPPYKSIPSDRTYQPLPKQISSLSVVSNNIVDTPSVDKKAKAIDLEDAFKNIKLEQDEKFADKFREDVLLARCWEMWRQGFIWITVR